MAVSPQQQLQAQRAYYLSGLISFMVANPYRSPYQDNTDMPAFAAALLTLQADILSGATSPDIANLTIQIALHQWPSPTGYFFSNEFIQDLIQFTQQNGGNAAIWNGATPNYVN